MREKDVFSSAFLCQPSLGSRLLESFREARRQFGEDPRQYLTLAIRGDGVGGPLRVDRLRFGLALSVTIYMILIGTSFLLWSLNKGKPPLPEMTTIRWIWNPGRLVEPPKSPVLDENSGGGGGGLRSELRPPTIGDLPEFSNDRSIIAPTTRIQIQPPSLAVPERLEIDPRLQQANHEVAPTGIPTGPLAPPSDGPGSDGGIGTSHGGGMGPGTGPGYGPGKNGGIGGGPGGSGGRRPDGDAAHFASRPVPLNHPRPNYTEQARQRRVQGVIKANVLVGPDGAVKAVHILTGLPDGLEEEAIRAAYEMRFRPAVSNGRPIDAWVTLEIEFNLR